MKFNWNHRCRSRGCVRAGLLLHTGPLTLTRMREARRIQITIINQHAASAVWRWRTPPTQSSSLPPACHHLGAGPAAPPAKFAGCTTALSRSGVVIPPRRASDATRARGSNDEPCTPWRDMIRAAVVAPSLANAKSVSARLALLPRARSRGSPVTAGTGSN